MTSLRRAPRLRLLVKLTLLGPLVVSVPLLNVWVDPSGVLSSHEARLAEILLSGSDAAFERYGQRAFQVEFARRTPPIDVLVTGSSRGKQIGRAFAPHARLFNASVNMCNLLDHIALAELYRGAAPRAHVLVLDPWVFNANAPDHGEEDFHAVRRAALERMGLPAPEAPPVARPPRHDVWVVARELLSPSNAQRSLETLTHQGVAAPTPIDASSGPYRIKRSNGRFLPPARVLERTPDLVRVVAWRTALGTPPGALHQHAHDDAFVRRLDRFLADLHDRGVATVIVLPPFHPVLYQQWVERRGFSEIPRAEQVVREVAARHGVPCLGSFDPRRLGATESQFYDGVHPFERGLMAWFGSELQAFLRDACPP